MKPPEFEYHRPDSLAEAIDVLARYGSEATVLAGGQSLMPQLALRRARPKHLVDLQRLGELTTIERAGGYSGSARWSATDGSSVTVRCRG